MLAEDGCSCRDYDGYLLYSERTILKSVHLSDENNLNAPIKPFEDPDHMKNVIALTFDYRGGGGKGANRIFFSDIHFGNIQQISDDGSDRKTVVESEYSHSLCKSFLYILFLFIYNLLRVISGFTKSLGVNIKPPVTTLPEEENSCSSPKQNQEAFQLKLETKHSLEHSVYEYKQAW